MTLSVAVFHIFQYLHSIYSIIFILVTHVNEEVKFASIRFACPHLRFAESQVGMGFEKNLLFPVFFFLPLSCCTIDCFLVIDFFVYAYFARLFAENGRVYS